MPTVFSICHHERSEPESTQPLLMGATSKSKAIWQHGGVVYIQYPVFDLIPPPPSASFLVLLWVFPLPVYLFCFVSTLASPPQSSPCLFFTVVYTNVFLCLQFHCLSHKPKQTHKSLFSPTLSSSNWLLRWCRLTWTGCFYTWLIPPPNLTFVVDVRCLLRCEQVCD